MLNLFAESSCEGGFSREVLSSSVLVTERHIPCSQHNS